MKKTYLTPVTELYGVDLKAVVLGVSGDYEKFEEGSAIGVDEN